MLEQTLMRWNRRTGLVLASLGVLTACGTRTDGAGQAPSTGSSAETTFPSAVYAGCTLFANGGGGEVGLLEESVLSLTTSGTSVTGSFGVEGDAGPIGIVDLVATSSTSATLSAPGQRFAGEWGSCGAGATRLDSGAYVVSSPLPAAANIELVAANAVVANGVAFLSFNGPVDDIDGGPGCAPDAPAAAELTALVMCTHPIGGSTTASSATATSATGAAFTAGSYSCYGQAARTSASGGGSAYSAGTLLLARNGSSISATYSGDPFASGALTFAATSGTTAVAAAGQAWTVESLATTSTAAALTANGTTLFLGVAGNAGTEQTTTTLLVCTPS
jgi:hypothetical protein